MKMVAFSGPPCSGKTTVLQAIAPILGAHVVTLPSPRVVPGLPPDAPARVCRDAALGLGYVRGRVALLADCLAAVEDARGREGLTLASCCALDTAAHQGELEAVLRLCGAVRPDLVVVLDAPNHTICQRLAARGGAAPTPEEVMALRRSYVRAANSALADGWRVEVVRTNCPIAEVVDEVLAVIREAV